ncbi:MAG: GldG family protein [Endozoicomonadaceae bacterium]|nr:GldG family protein [Endozoicomonadaceae bacterium]
MTTKLFPKAGLVALAVLVLLITVVSQFVFRGARVDLTEDKLYTLSQGTKKLMKDLQEPVTLKLFYSRKATEGIPQLRNYADRVEELLREYSQVSKGRVTLEVIDPEPFSEQEEDAAGYGLKAVPLSVGNREAYLGLVALSQDAVVSDKETAVGDQNGQVTDEVGRKEVIGFFHPDKESFLEYDISNLIYSVSQKTRPMVAVISGVPVKGGYDYTTHGSNNSWMSITQLERLYDVQYLGNSVTEISSDIGLLILILPHDVSEGTLYAIDQYVLRGGHALVFLDPYAEEAAQNVGTMMGGDDGGPRSAYLDTLLSSWGVEMVQEQFVADEDHALSVGSQTGQSVRHLGVLGLKNDSFNRSDVVMSNLKVVNFSSAGALKLKEGASVTMEPLIQSGINSALLGVAQLESLSDPRTLYKEYRPSGERYVLAARITGKIKTAFPDGRPEPRASGEDAGDSLDITPVPNDKKPLTGVPVEEEEAEAKEAVGKRKQEQVNHGVGGEFAGGLMRLVVSEKPINLIIVADTDVLSNRLWVQVNDFFGQQVVTPFANNGDMVINLVDNLMGNADLISIRSRGQYSRPFTKVDELERSAQASFMDKEEELTRRLQETEQKLFELQAMKEGNDTLVLSTDQLKGLARFQQQKLKIRKELRDVQHQLNQDIENLGSRLKLINIFAVPFLLTVIVIGFRIRQSRRELSH